MHSSPQRFRDRHDAGRQLARALASVQLDQPVVLGLPRGGVPVAYEVALALDAPLDVFVARKLGAPMQPELGVGAIAEGDARVADVVAARTLGIQDAAMRAVEHSEREELERRVERYRHGRHLPPLERYDVVVVDDGLATGVTAEAALLGLEMLGARRLVMGVPVAPPETVERLKLLAEVVTVLQPEHLRSVGEWYEDFAQTTDDEVDRLLREAAARF